MPISEKPVVLLTGASSGIGREAARELAAQGWQVAVMARSAQTEALAAELGGLAIRGDVTDAADIQRLVEAAQDRFGRIDGAVVSTGHPANGDLLTLSQKDWHGALDLVLMSVVRMVEALQPVFATAGRGSIVAVSTYAAREPSLDYPLSSVFRAGLGAFIRLCTSRHAGEGWRINAVLPGIVDNFPAHPDKIALIPQGRPVRARDELAKTIAFLLADGAGAIAGQQIVVDGGLSRCI